MARQVDTAEQRGAGILYTMGENGGCDLKRKESRNWAERILSHFPPGQFGRYLIVGLANAAFGYGTYAGLTALLTPHLPYPYVFAYMIAYFLNVTFSFLNYKWFIFKTKGRYLQEWMRCIAVYGATALLGTSLLAPTVFAIRHFAGVERAAPYLAGVLISAITLLTGFMGHRSFSFAPKRSPELKGAE